jgi:colanic acid/amylovoran biosynthesis glycosyltransferase
MALQSEHVAKAIDAKMAVSFRGFDIDVFPLKHQAPYELIWKHVEKVHSISEYLLLKAYQLGLSKGVAYQIINPAVDVASLPERKTDQSPIKIISVGRLHWIKGLTYVLEALSILKAKNISFEFTIVGDGPESQEITFAIQQLGLSNQVFIYGRKTHEETKQLMAKSDIYIQYSLSEGFCNAVLEAQAIGLLCVVSDGGALPENVIDTRTGWIVQKRSPDLLATKIEKIINLPLEEQMQVRQEARKRVQNNFNLKKQELEFKTFYE